MPTRSARVTSRLEDGGPQFTYEIPLAGRAEDDALRDMNQLWRRNIKKAAKAGVEVTAGRLLRWE